MLIPYDPIESSTKNISSLSRAIPRSQFSAIRYNNRPRIIQRPHQADFLIKKIFIERRAFANRRNGSFSTCHRDTVEFVLYLSTIFPIISRSSASLFSLLKALAQSGIWHSGHLGCFCPTVSIIFAFLLLASLICQSRFSKL